MAEVLLVLAIKSDKIVEITQLKTDTQILWISRVVSCGLTIDSVDFPRCTVILCILPKLYNIVYLTITVNVYGNCLQMVSVQRNSSVLRLAPSGFIVPSPKRTVVMAPEDDDGQSQRIESKVARLVEDYGLGQQFGDQLEARWTADGDERDSLRTLADRFNERLLEAAAADAGLSTVDGESANLYRLLTDDDVSSGNRTEARRRLERAGVDVDQLDEDFVSYQAIRSYLTEYRNAEYNREPEQARPERVVQTLQRLTERVRSVADRSLTQLRDTRRLTLGEFRLFVDVSVLCEDCGSQYSVVELIRRGGCECDD